MPRGDVNSEATTHPTLFHTNEPKWLFISTFEFLFKNGFYLIREHADEQGYCIQASRASAALLRLIGPWATDPVRLPVRLHIRVRRDQLVDLFFGFERALVGRWGYEERMYQLCFHELVAQYKAACLT